ncbi:MAG: hypothetical protein NCW75_13985 [Phycisphaera sp.]|nr:MAG: hypothetical protein NCW75_13985 [Phycisphaera sp.]
MDDTLRQSIERFTAELASWLEQPGEASKELAAIRFRIDTLKGQLSGPGLNEMLKGLADAERAAERQRQHEAALAIAELCRPLGVVLEPKEPPKRKPRARSQNKPTAQPRGE